MNRMTVYDQTRLCFKVTTHQEPGRSVIQELGIYEDIHEEEIKKARNITDVRDLYFTKGAKLDPYWENLGKPKTERSGWIPVTERLPEPWASVLITFSGKYGNMTADHAVGVGSWDGGNGWYFEEIEGYTEQLTVDAWMNLPDPFEGEVDG